MHTSTKALLIGVALLSAGSMSVAGASGASTAARGHAAIPANPCAATLPANQVLTTEGGAQTYTTLRGGGYTFALDQYGPQGLNKEVRRLSGATLLPAGDAVAAWRFTLPGGTRAYAGLAHVFRYGAQGLAQEVCLWGGVSYLNLGNGAAAVRARAVTVTLTALIGVRAGSPGQVALRVDGAHYLVAGYLRVR